MRDYGLTERRLRVFLHGFAAAPSVDTAVGVGGGIAEPDLAEEARDGAECWGELRVAGVLILRLSDAVEVEVDDLDMHGSNSVAGVSHWANEGEMRI